MTKGRQAVRFSFPHGADTAVDERDGLVGRRDNHDWNHAICLAGGSLPGLEAAAGVSTAYFEQHGSSLDRMGLVSGAIIYDYGRHKNTKAYRNRSRQEWSCRDVSWL